MLWETFYHIAIYYVQSKVLESIQLEYKDSQEKLASLQGDMEKQLHDIQERRRSLQDQEAELKAEEERLTQLRAASAKETEELLRKQKSDLKDAISQEKKTLKSLKEYVSFQTPLSQLPEKFLGEGPIFCCCCCCFFRSRTAVESEVHELSQRKMTLELCVEQLGQEELRHRESLAQQTNGEGRQRSEMSPLSDQPPAPTRTTNGDGGDIKSASSVHLAEEQDGGMGGTEGGESWEEGVEEETGQSDTAMDILDLEPTVSKVLVIQLIQYGMIE